jgi:uncharacterized protein YhaN
MKTAEQAALHIARYLEPIKTDSDAAEEYQYHVQDTIRLMHQLMLELEAANKRAERNEKAVLDIFTIAQENLDVPHPAYLEISDIVYQQAGLFPKLNKEAI